MSVFLVLVGCLIISFVVFGGGQMFIPYYKIMLVNILKISEEDWNQVLSIANATPGVFGLKLSFVSGYLIANNNWWGFLLTFGTYTAFILVPIIFILFTFKKYTKHKNDKFMINFTKIMRPIIAGIFISIIVNLSISLLLPFVNFNNLNNYFEWKNEKFFVGWRYYALVAWTLFSIPSEYVIMKKYKINSIQMICTNIVICLIIFQPWLM